ncbi:MAG: hypothetical protein ACJAX5_002510 [Patiriisocius sp.]
MKLATINRYPVKSMGGDSLTSASLTEWGIPGDRAWAVKDESRNSIKGGKRFPELMAMKARFITEPDQDHPSPGVEIILPNDHEVTSNDADVNDQLSRSIGAKVSLWPLLPKTQLDHYRREPMPEDGDVEANLRQIFARTSSEPLPDLSGFPKELFEYESPPGTYFDAFPLLLMTTGSIESMQKVSNASNYDPRRFRPNLLIDLPGAFPENQWVGRQAKLGSAVIKIEMVCPRCVMTTHGFRDLPKDPTVMRELVKHNDGNLGVYCSIVKPGMVTAGDLLELL